MRTTAWPRLHGVFTLLAAVGAVCAQNNSSLMALPDRSPAQAAVQTCPEGTDFEKEKFRIVHATVEDPFKFLYWKGIDAKFRAMLDNRLFTYKLKTDALRLIEDARFTPDNENFVIKYERVDVRNCDPNAKTLDLTFTIYSTDPPKFLGGATESQATAEKSPQTTAGLGQTGNPFHFTPSGGYDRSDGLYGGGRIEVAPKLGGFHLCLLSRICGVILLRRPLSVTNFQQISKWHSNIHLTEKLIQYPSGLSALACYMWSWREAPSLLLLRRGVPASGSGPAPTTGYFGPTAARKVGKIPARQARRPALRFFANSPLSFAS